MAYLTHDDYTALGYTAATADNFATLLAQASRVIDDLTNDFYQLNDLADDPINARVKAFKRAICEEIDFIASVGSVKSYDLAQNDVNSISIGRLSLSPSKGMSKVGKMGVAPEAVRLLGRYGLLFRGVGA